jgi:hypothetical protein
MPLYNPATAGGGAESWDTVSGTTQTAAVNKGYLANNAARVTITLPATASIGAVIRVTGAGAGGWKVAQLAGQQIHFGNVSTIVGTGGSLQSTAVRDSVKLSCIVANTTWNVVASVGSITVT